MSLFGLPMQLPRFDVALTDRKSADPRVRMAACVALSLGDADAHAEAVNALASLLRDPVAEIRAQAVVSLADLGLSGAELPRRELKQCLEDGDAQVRQAAIEHLDLFCTSPEEHAMKHISDPYPGIRVSVLRVLRGVDFQGDTAPVVALLSDRDELVRQEAAMTLAARGDESGVAILLDMVRKRSPEAPEAVCQLARLAQSGALNEVVAVLRDAQDGWFASATLRAMAAAALAGIPGGTVDGILRMLRARRHRVRMEALSALSLLPCEAALDELVQMAKATGREFEASAALVALGEARRLFPEETIRRLTEISHSVNGVLREELKRMMQ